jgi:hypothetical protein
MTGWKGRRAETDVTGCESGGAGQGRGVGRGASGTLLAVAGSVALVLVDWRLWLAQSTSGGRRNSNWRWARSGLVLAEWRRAVSGGVTTGGGLCRTRCWSIGGLGWRGAPSVQLQSVEGVVRTGAGLCCTRCWSTDGFGCAAPSVRRRAVAGGVATGAGRGQAWCWRSAALTDAETFSPPSCGGRSRIAAWPRVCPESASFCSVPSMLRLAVAV